MTVINTNVNALYSQLALQNTSKSQSSSMQQLSTGMKINSAADNAAGMAIVNRMHTQISGISQSIQNAGDAVNLIHTAEGAANQITTMLQRMQQLATESANGTYNDSQRQDLDLEFQQLKQQIVAISNNTQWNGFPVLNGTAGKQLSPYPVYKAVSAPKQSNIFISPSPSITVSQPNIAQQVGFGSATIDSRNGGAPLAFTPNPADLTTVPSAVFTDGTNTYSVPFATTESNTLTSLVQKINGGSNPYTASVNNGNLIFTANTPGVALPSTMKLTIGALAATSGYVVPASMNPGDSLSVTFGNTTVSSTLNTVNTSPAAVASDLANQLNANTTFNQSYNAQINAGQLQIIPKDATVSLSTLQSTFNVDQVVDSSPSALAAGVSTESTFVNNTAPFETAYGTGPNSVNSEQNDDPNLQAPSNYNSASLLGQQSFASPGTWLQTGALSMNLDSRQGDGSTVTATFLASNGKTVNMVGTLHPQTGTVNFDSTLPINAQVISGDLTVNILQDATNPTQVDLTKSPPTQINNPSDADYMTTVNIAVQGSIPTLNAGDLTINGVVVPTSLSTDDKVSPANNAAGSAIAKAAAINKVTAQTGVTAIVNQNTMEGSAMSGATVVNGNVMINGIVTPQITSVLNDPRASRLAVITAVNSISKLTGVTAVDSGNNSQGVSLVAPDGRNIEVQFENIGNATTQDFQARTGLTQGVQGGTYSLESKVAQPITIGTTPNGNLSDSGLSPGNYTANVSTVTTQKYTTLQPGQQPTVLNSGESVINPGQSPVILNQGDLVINGVAIPGATSGGDILSQNASVSATSAKIASANATAAAINTQTSLTGVTAVANPATIAGSVTGVNQSIPNGFATLYVNGVGVQVDLETSQTPSQRIQAVINALNPVVGETGVSASINPQGQGVQLTTTDGRNLSVWYDSAQYTASDFGLGGNPQLNAPGVTGIPQATASSGSYASTVYGTVSLQSNKPIDVQPGINGYTSASNFTALGFSAGTSGGLAKDAQTLLAPPLVGQLQFQIGPDANQTVSIDLPDFGSNGSITGDITWDVNQTAPAAGTVMPTSTTGVPSAQPQRSYISSQSAAEAMITRLGKAIDNISATVSVMGAVMNRLSYVTNNLQSMSVNLTASQSAIQDTNYAQASTNLSRTQIMQQAATAVLAQANTSQQTVLKLLQG